MLTPEHRQLLAQTATSKYGLEIKASQIAHLVLDKFECNMILNKGADRFLIHGEVVDFRAFPLQMDFLAPEGSPEREALLHRLNIKKKKNKKVNLQFVCQLASVGRIVLVNTLSISSSQFQELGITEKLFGPASSTYVTREQLNQLAGTIYSSFNIVEEFEMPELQFQPVFVEEMIRQAAAGHFQQVPALQAIKELSSFGIDFIKDLQPGRITHIILNIQT
jgi:hypothetical protein